ncbi:MAG: AAA family ATPase [Anaerolineaceae bacterium]|nr:AAA family ATPase [Anaerolineaceae bacterium]
MFILLLGSPSILIDQRPFETLRRKNRALIFFLAAHPEPVTRDQILALFWPDTPRPSAQQILRSMLHDLRKQFQTNTFLFEEDRLSVGPQVQVDTTQFEAGLASPGSNPSALAATMALYRGEFLEAFTLPDTPSFDDWLVSEREVYRSMALRGYSALSRLQEAEHNFSAALDTLSHALTFDPLQEDLQRDCLRLHYLNGDRAGAVRRYETLRKLLDEEMGVPPMPETRSMYEAIINDRLPTSKPKPAGMPVHTPIVQPSRPAVPLLQFTGRASEIEKLKSLSSTGKLTLIEGAPGIGKTRLVEEFIYLTQKQSRPAALPALIIKGVAHELEQGLPYQPVVDALRSLLTYPDWPVLRVNLDLPVVWLSEISRLLPELRTQITNIPDPLKSEDESRLWEGVLQLLQSLSRQRKIVLFFDDIHWADSSTVGLIGYLARRMSALGIVMIVTARLLDVHSKLALLVKVLIHEQRLSQISLAPLSTDDTKAIAGQLTTKNPDLLSDWLYEHADGNPYFLTELVRHAYDTNVLHKDGEMDTVALDTFQILSPTIQNLILSRIINLTENARHVLDVAAAIGREFNFELVHQTLSVSEPARSESFTLDAFDELRASVLIQPRHGESYTFDHSLTMEVVLQDMGEPRSRFLHRQLAQTLERVNPEHLDQNAGLIAQHFIKGSAPNLAAPYAIRAGRYSAGLTAWAEAIVFYENALDAGIGGIQRTETLIALGYARFHKGDFAKATDTYYKAIELARSQPVLTNLEAAYLGINLSLLPQSRFAEAIALGRDLALYGPPELSLCAQFIWGAGLSVESANPLEAEVHLREAERLIDEQSDYSGQVSCALVKYQLAAVLGQQGKSLQAVKLYREALTLVLEDESALDLMRQILLYNNLAYHLHLLGDPTAADYAQAGIKLAQQRGSLTHMPSLLSTSGEIALQNNDLDKAEQYFTEGLRLAEQVPIPERIAGLTANLALVNHRRGLNDLARQRLLKSLELAEQLGVLHLAVRIRCWLVPLLPSFEARTRLQEARQIAEKSGFNSLLEEINLLEQNISLL